MQALWLGAGAAVVAATVALAPAAAAAKRSSAVRAAFVLAHPCPSTGQPYGACPGYQVDHREALVCGGSDTLDNLQWLDIDTHKAKTRVEVKLCRTHKKPTPQLNPPRPS